MIVQHIIIIVKNSKCDTGYLLLKDIETCLLVCKTEGRGAKEGKYDEFKDGYLLLKDEITSLL